MADMQDTPEKRAQELRLKIGQAKLDRMKNSGNGMFSPPPSKQKQAQEDRDVYNKLQNLREEEAEVLEQRAKGMKKGGAVKSSASKRGDGIAQRGKTRGRML